MSKKYLGEIMKDRVFTTNTLIVSPTGSGKTHYIFNNLCKDKKVLYLCDNSNLEEQVSSEDNTRVAKDKKPKRGFDKTNIIVMTYKYFGAKIKFDLEDEYVNGFDLIIADEVHNLVDYQSFNNDADLANVIRVLMRKYENTPILMFTATPYYLDELAKNNPGIDRNYEKIDFSKSKEVMRYINKREAYLNHISQIQFALEEYKQSFEYSNMKCLIYVSKIEDMKFVQDMCLDRKLKPICIWSTNNSKHYMNDEQMSVRKHLIDEGMLKQPYNVLIINRSTETGVNIYDDKMQLVIVNTTNLTQQVQARGRVRHDVDLLVVKTKDNKKVDTITIKDEVLDKPLLKTEIEDIIKEYNIKDSKRRYITVNKFGKFLSNNEYEMITTRRTVNGKKNTYYIIKRTKNGATL